MSSLEEFIKDDALTVENAIPFQIARTDQLQYLSAISVVGCGLTSFPAQFRSRRLKTMDLSDNQLQDAGFVQNFIHLTTLDLSCN